MKLCPKTSSLWKKMFYASGERAGNLVLPRTQNKTHRSEGKEKVKYSLGLGEGQDSDLGSNRERLPMAREGATLLRNELT